MSSEYDKYSTPREEPSQGQAPGPFTPRNLLIIGLVSALLASSLLLAIAESGRISSNARADNAPTATATATVTPSPTPPPAIGFKVYTDANEGFQIQYPQTWSYSPLTPGVEFADDSNETGYAVQVAMANSSALSGQQGNPNDPSTWVTYELNFLAQRYPENFILLNTGSETRVIGGISWQSGAGLITNNSAGIRVQVYATVYNGKPYIINLLAANDRFSAGAIEFFDPMLNSYEFLLTTP